MYRFIRPLLFRMDSEQAHWLALQGLKYLPTACFSQPAINPVQVMGLTFPHRIGLAAGFDKNAEFVHALAKLGFAFIEVGTVTPKAQAGQAKPRLFRIPQARALINRMGFNNVGVDTLVQNIQAANYTGILGVNIGKNKDTPLSMAVDDYLYCLRKVYPIASYVTVNISSPNTPHLRELQRGDYFDHLMSTLREEQLHLSDVHQRYVPLVVKLSPDEGDDVLKHMAHRILFYGIDGILATNTTAAREGVSHLKYGKESGGLSGAPLATRSTHCLRVIKSVVGEEVALIAAGGIDSVLVAKEKLAAGASLLQVYTGLIYEGPDLVASLSELI